VTVTLHVIRASGVEKHEVQADGDVVHVSYEILTSHDVIGLEVEVEEAEAGRARGGDRGGASAGGPGNPTPGSFVPGSPGSARACRTQVAVDVDPFFRMLDEIGWHTPPDLGVGTPSSRPSERLPRSMRS
jgi:hypothetical protein